MAPDREPRWLSKEPVKTANAEFNEALKNDPFTGAVAVEALAQFIKATDEVRTSTRAKVSPEEATAQIIHRIEAARDAAIAAPDPTYAQIFSAQLEGWSAPARIINDEAGPQQAPTSTARKSMSQNKSNPKTR